jgi:hypothetical protein
MKEYTTEEIFNELWKRIEYDANVSEELATECNELQERIDKAIKFINTHDLYHPTNEVILLNILRGSDSNEKD